jgi:hypothetical protein
VHFPEPGLRVLAVESHPQKKIRWDIIKKCPPPLPGPHHSEAIPRGIETLGFSCPYYTIVGVNIYNFVFSRDLTEENADMPF